MTIYIARHEKSHRAYPLKKQKQTPERSRLLPVICDDSWIAGFVIVLAFQPYLFCQANNFLLHLSGIKLEVLVFEEEDRHEARDMRTGHGRPRHDSGGPAAGGPEAGDVFAGGVETDAGAKV